MSTKSARLNVRQASAVLSGRIITLIGIVRLNGEACNHIYTGRDLVKGYRNWLGVTTACAIIELRRAHFRTGHFCTGLVSRSDQ